MEMGKKIEVEWLDYINMCRSLSFKISEAKLSVSHITGPPRGGVIPAVILSHALDLRYIEWKDFMHYISKNSSSIKEVLIVDDITCTGDTLSYYPAHIKAVLYKRSTSIVRPQIFLKEVEQGIWIKFPYEK